MYRGVRSGFGVLRLPELVLLFLCLVFGEAFCGVEALAAPDGKRGRAVPDRVVALSLVEDDDDKGDAIFELVLLKDKAEGAIRRRSSSWGGGIFRASGWSVMM